MFLIHKTFIYLLIYLFESYRNRERQKERKRFFLNCFALAVAALGKLSQAAARSLELHLDVQGKSWSPSAYISSCHIISHVSIKLSRW